MKVGVLFSGGKDSSYALFKAMRYHDIACLISIDSENPHSYMFHTPNIGLVKYQSRAMSIPLLVQKTKGEKEEELNDLEIAIQKAINEYEIRGIVTGAIESVYQASRVQKICNRLGLWCFNPLWKINQIKLLRETVEKGFETIIVGIAAAPFDESWLGRKIDEKIIQELEELSEKYKINPAGEGGEFETFVTAAPFFSKRIQIMDNETKYKNHTGVYHITKVELEDHGIID